MAAERSRTTTLTSKAFLEVNHPEIALTLEKSLIQGETIVCFPWIERFFYELYNFSWNLQVIARRFYKSNVGEPMDGNWKYMW